MKKFAVSYQFIPAPKGGSHIGASELMHWEVHIEHERVFSGHTPVSKGGTRGSAIAVAMVTIGAFVETEVQPTAQKG